MRTETPSLPPFHTESLEQRIRQCGNSVCMGIDPVLELIPLDQGSAEERIRRFYLSILEELVKRSRTPAVVKPNSGYFECVSVQAMLVLQEIIREYKREGIMVVLDAKRGDIGKSSQTYAKAAFDVYGADSVTVSPWMGTDSVKPFMEYRAGRGVYVLLRTSNPGAKDFQDLPVEDTGKAFQAIANKMLTWDNGSLGAVVGATDPGELESITRWFVQAGREIPFLIPGVSIPGVPGQQGGDVVSVVKAMIQGGSRRRVHVLNSSSGLNYAWQASGNSSAYAIACADAFERLADSIENAYRVAL